MKRKVLSIVMSAMMVAALVGCSSGGGTTAPAAASSAASEAASTAASEAAPAETTEAADTASGDEAKIAVVTDVGQLMDKGFNQGTYEGAQAYADDNGISMKYYQPANGSDATDNDRIPGSKDFDILCAEPIGLHPVSLLP